MTGERFTEFRTLFKSRTYSPPELMIHPANQPPPSDLYEEWLRGIRHLAKTICFERRLGRTDQDLADLCKPLLQQIDRDYAALKTETSRRRST